MTNPGLQAPRPRRPFWHPPPRPPRIADMLRDAPIVEEVRQDAIKLVQSDSDLQNPAYERLKRQVLKRFGEALELGDMA